MPFAWTAIWLQNIIKSKVNYQQDIHMKQNKQVDHRGKMEEQSSLRRTKIHFMHYYQEPIGGHDSGGSDAEGGGNASNSLDRKHTSTASFEQYRRKHGSVTATSSNSGDSSLLARRGKT